MTQNSTYTPFLLGSQDAQTACLLIHGFSGTPEEMRGLGEALAAQGIRVYGMLVAGHSEDPETLLRSGRKTWLASAEQGLRQLEGHPHLFVAGLSMGGVLALSLAARHPERIAGVIAMSTPTRFGGGWQMKLVPLAGYVMKWYYPLARLNFNDPRVQADVLKQARARDATVTVDFADAETVAHIKQMVRVPVPAIAELFRLVAQGRRQLHRVRVPLLILQSKRDQTVMPECADEVYRLATAAVPKSLHWLELSDHVITTGPEHEEVYQSVLTFINATIPGAARIAQPGDAQREASDGSHPDH